MWQPELAPKGSPMEETQPLNTVQQQRLQVIEDLRREGIEPYGRRFDRTHSLAAAKAAFEEAEGQAETKEHFEWGTHRLAGRLTSKREQGKTAFGHIEDVSGTIQVYFRKDGIGEAAFTLLKRLYAGDIIGVEGPLFRTRTGEISLRAVTFTILSKSITPMPEKWHGLTDVEIRYRQRYADLLANAEVRQTFIRRSRLMQEIRHYMTNRDFLEVETPMMHPVAGGAAARPFITHHNALDLDLYLRIAPELYLKRLLVGGFDKVFEINRNFRNEGLSIKHNPEFTMMEVYEAYGDMRSMLELTEDLLCTVTASVFPDLQVVYQGETLDFSRPWKRLPMLEAVRQITGQPDLSFASPREQAVAAGKAVGIVADPGESTAKILVRIFEEKVEHTLRNPTFVVGYPKETSPLAKGNADDPTMVDRFELFIFGREIANAFSELNDPEEQRRRFEDQLSQRARGDDEAHQMDHDYVNALRYGMPPAGGLGIGIDRVAMLLTDSASIRDVILFPTMRPRGVGPQESEPAAPEA
jgi:lysyl-tRNA synthetase, class II